jgi:hypothetical protein
MESGATVQEKFKVLPSKVKIHGLALMVVPVNGLVESIVL